jgi:hypothetical protein
VPRRKTQALKIEEIEEIVGKRITGSAGRLRVKSGESRLIRASE